MPCVSGASWTWEFADPNRLLALLVSSSTVLEDVFSQAAKLYPCSKDRPWQLVIGFDEFIPGNKLKTHNERKTMNVSFTFVELGRDAMWHEDLWITPVCVRHTMIAKVASGFSAMLRRYLRLQLLGANGLTTSGVPLMLHGQPFLLFASLRYIIADGEGLKLGLGWKGANAVKPCFKHWNVVSKRSHIATVADSFVDICCSNPAHFARLSDGELNHAIDMLLEALNRVGSGEMTKTNLDKLQKSIGFAPTPTGLLADLDLRHLVPVTKVFLYDWVHTLLQDGVMQEECFRLITSVSHLGVSMQTLQAFMQEDWRFPASSSAKSKSLHHIFDVRRVPDQNRLKSTASEMLGAYGLMRHFVEVRIPEHESIAAAMASFKAACAVMDVIKATNYGRIPLADAPQLMRVAVTDFMSKHSHAYGREYVRPKHHWLFDIADQWEGTSLIVDCFIIERLHLRMKAVADKITNTNQYERTVTASIMNAQLRRLEEAVINDGLQGRTAMVRLDGVPLVVSDTVSLGGIHISVNDLVLKDAHAGFVIACAREGSDLFAVVKKLVFARQVSDHSSEWRLTPGVAVWRVADLHLPLAWKGDGDSWLVIRM